MSVSKSSGRLFWVIIGLLFAICLLNYFDRQTLSILKTTLKEAIGFDDVQYSHLVLAFMLPYIVMYLASGWIIDRFGTRVSMTVFVTLWSAATLFSGLSQNFGQLFASRVLLGAAEPVTFPLSQRIILDWAPERRRAFAMSLVAPAGSVGAVLAPPLVAWVALTIDWRAAFFLPGVIGLVVAVLWWRLDRLPERETAVAKPTPLPAGDLFRNRDFWGILAARMVSDPVWFFFLFWIPGYLQESVGLSLGELGLVGGIPYFAALVLCLVFGRLVDAQVARGRDASRVQLTLFAATAALMPTLAFITAAPNLLIAMTMITVVTAIAQSWFAGTGVLLAAHIPHRLNALALGMLGAVGASSGLVLNLAAGSLIEQFGYGLVFGVLACMHPLAAVILWLTLGRRKPSGRGWTAQDAEDAEVPAAP